MTEKKRMSGTTRDPTEVGGDRRLNELATSPAREVSWMEKRRRDQGTGLRPESFEEPLMGARRIECRREELLWGRPQFPCKISDGTGNTSMMD